MTDDAKDAIWDTPPRVVTNPPDAPRRSLKDLADKAKPDDAEDDLDSLFVSVSHGDDATGGPIESGLPPVTAIARAALDAALPADLRARLADGDAIAVVVSVPGPDWVDEIRMVVGDLTAFAHYVARDGAQRKQHLPTSGNMDVGTWLAAGRPVVGISQAPASFLPSALLAAADATVDVRAPDGATLARILALTGRKPPPDIPDGACSGMTFAEILSAFRRGLDGHGVVDALGRMSARKAATDADDGVPALPDLPGHSGEARAWGTALIGDFADWRAGRRAWRDVSASAVLDGPPGTGKTVFARSLAKALGVTLISTGVGDWFARTEGNLGDVAVAFQSAWDRAMAARPCVFFLDELDAIPDRARLSNRGRDWWLPIITLILTTTDGAQTARDGLVLIGATNHGDHLDAALVRRGRFDRLIHVGLPTTRDLAEIVGHHLDGAISVGDLESVAALALAATAADAAAWAREARSSALAAGRPVALADVLAAVAPPDDRPESVVRRTAIHEAGHVVVGRRLGARLHSVSIVAIGDAGGRTATLHESGLATAQDIDRIATGSLGGRAAEQVLLGAPSAGAVGDLAKVTALLASVHASVGLGDTLLHRAGDGDATALLNVDPGLRKTVETHMARLYADALRIVEAERDVVLRIADALVARRHLDADDIAALAGRPHAGNRT